MEQDPPYPFYFLRNAPFFSNTRKGAAGGLFDVVSPELRNLTFARVVDSFSPRLIALPLTHRSKVPMIRTLKGGEL
jgi:hypothetical protein